MIIISVKIMAKENSLRSQLKATSIKRLRKQIDEDNAMVGAQSSTEYLNLEDGKTVKIRIFPGHPGVQDFPERQSGGR